MRASRPHLIEKRGRDARAGGFGACQQPKPPDVTFFLFRYIRAGGLPLNIGHFGLRRDFFGDFAQSRKNA